MPCITYTEQCLVWSPAAGSVDIFLPVAQDPKVLLEEYTVCRRSIDTVNFPKTEKGIYNHLIEEHIFPISSLCCKIFKVPILANSVLLTQLLPELASD